MDKGVSADERHESLESKVAHYMSIYGNCAQTSFHTLQEWFQLGCDAPSIVRGLKPFPGMGLTQETCGAVSGCLLALGLRYGTNDKSDKDRCMERARQFCSAVQQEIGSTRCGDIMERRFGRRFDLLDPTQKQQFVDAGAVQECTTVVQTAVKIAAALLEESSSAAREPPRGRRQRQAGNTSTGGMES